MAKVSVAEGSSLRSSAIRPSRQQKTDTLVLAFAQLGSVYSMVNRASFEESTRFAQPDNHHPAQLLLIHFNLIEFDIGYRALGEDLGHRFAYRKKVCITWTERLHAKLSDKYKTYLQWPMNYARRLRAS